MGADDIVERLGQWAEDLMPDFPVTADMIRQAAAAITGRDAEIGRLRGEVEKWQGLAEAGVTLAEIQRRREQRIAKRETTAPAMPNGVEWQWVSDQFDFLEGLVNQGTYREIVDKAVSLLDNYRAADNRDAAGVCATCNGAGMVGGYTKDGPWGEDCPACTHAAVPAGEAVAVYEGNPCVECGEDTGTGHFPGCCLGTTPQPADGEASMFAGQSDAQIAHAVRMAEQHYRSLGRDPVYCNVSLSVLRDCTPPAPVQAAPQEGEAECPTCKAPVNTIVHARGGDWGWGTSDKERTTYRYAHHSACELGAREVATVTTTSGPYGTVGAHRVALSPEFDAWLDQQPAGTVVALQHRGDSRGGEG